MRTISGLAVVGCRGPSSLNPSEKEEQRGDFVLGGFVGFPGQRLDFFRADFAPQHEPNQARPRISLI